MAEKNTKRVGGGGRHFVKELLKKILWLFPWLGSLVYKKELRILQNSRYFDEKYYYFLRPDVFSKKRSAALHYLLYGWKEGTNPSEYFNTCTYLKTYPDINFNPLLHYELFGKNERRTAGIKPSLRGQLEALQTEVNNYRRQTAEIQLVVQEERVLRQNYANTIEELKKQIGSLSAELSRQQKDFEAMMSEQREKLEAMMSEQHEKLEARLKEQERVLSDWRSRETESRIKIQEELLKVRQDSYETARSLRDAVGRLEESSAKILVDDAKLNLRIEEAQKSFGCFQKEISEQLSGLNVYYDNDFERRTRLERGLCDMVKLPDFQSRFKKLISNLPEESVETLVGIVKRLQLINDGGKKKLDIFFPAEKEKLRELKVNFNQRILKISDSLFCYKNYFLPINHFEASVFYYKHGIDFVENISAFKNKDILDIGGFIGDSAILLSKLTDKTVYSFEASKENFNYLKQTLELNNLKNVVAENVAVGAGDGEIELLFKGSATSTSSLMIKNPDYMEKCKVIKIDDYVKEHSLNVGLIKVDIEGYEQEFLKGAMETIKTQRPTLLLSIYHSVSDFLDIKPMIEDLDLGYSFRIFKPTIESISGETLLICELL